MDVAKLVETLRSTLDPNQREQAEQQLTEVHKIIGFAPVLLQVVMSDAVDMPVRQAGVIYLKNMLTQYWIEREPENVTDNVPFNIHENDRAPIRDNIIEAIIHAPEPVRVQLCVCLNHMIKHDFPGRWPNVAEKMAFYIKADQPTTWMGALVSIYQFVKVFEYKRSEERTPMDEVMVHMVPVLHQRLVQLGPDLTEASSLLQKQVLKIYFAYTQNYLPMKILTKEVFTAWMEAIRQIIERAIPAEAEAVDEDERCELACWKLKKWAVHILSRLFERYGSPGNVVKEYNDFSEWYLKTFSSGVLNAMLKLMEGYRQKVYVAPRVMQQSLNYINQGISHAFSWKFIKPYMQTMIQDVIFPLMCHSDEDEDMWCNDPLEYIRIKYDVFEDFLSPVMAAQTVFHSATAKRKEVLNKAMGFCMSILNNTASPPRAIDGALHMVGAVAAVLLKRKIYKDQAEQMLTSHVFPGFASEHGFLRARACWVIRQFCELRYKTPTVVQQAVEHVRNALCTDKDLPVRVEAAIAVQMLISEQEQAKAYIQPLVKPVVLELLNVIRDTENDELTGVMQKLVCTYVEEVTPIAVDMMTHLAQTFAQIIESDSDGSEEKAISALGILNTMEAILSVMEDQKEIVVQLEAIVLSVIGIILQNNIIDFYEEVLSLIYSLTSTQISCHMWEVFGMIYQMFEKDGVDYFTDMMPALHNYITVDTPAFLAKPHHLEVIYNMCKQVMSNDVGEDAECHAAKLLEVILLQCPGQVDHVMGSFVELVLNRLTREVQTSELRTICLQVVIAAMYYNSALLLAEVLPKVSVPNMQQGSVLGNFLTQWMVDIDCILGLHDRKMSVLGLCSLMSMVGQRPQEVSDVANKILPAALMLFQGLKRAYASRAADEDSDDEDDEDDEEEAYDGNQGEVLSSDEDEIDDAGQAYMARLAKQANGHLCLHQTGEDSDSEDSLTDDGAEETALESYMTSLDTEACTVDEYQSFKTILSGLPGQDNAWYQALVAALTPAQQKEIEEVFKMADQRKAAAESKKIEETGGFNFTSRQVPTAFNFGS